MTAIPGLVRRFVAGRSAGVAVWFGLALVPLLFLAGAGLDLSRSVNQQSEMQAAADAAALAGASAYTSATSAASATAVATNYMNNFKTTSGLSSLTFQVTPGLNNTGASVTLYTMKVTAQASIGNTLMAMAKGSNAIGVSATAQNPVYNITISLSSFSANAADLNTISYYIVPADGSVPALAATTLIFSNATSTSGGSVTLQVTASQKIGFLLTNTTGGKQTCTTIFGLKVCTASSGYGYNGYGGAQGSVHTFYSHLSPPSRLAYPAVTQDCSLQVLSATGAAPVSGSCLGALPANAAVNCVAASGQTLNFYWNDMGGPSDDKDFNDAVYTVACSKVDSSVGKGLALTN